MIEEILKKVNIGRLGNGTAVMVFSPHSDNELIHDAIWEWLHGFYSEVFVQRNESIPQRIEFTPNDRETNQDITGYVLKGFYPEVHTGMVLGFINIWSSVNQRGMAYHVQFYMKRRGDDLRGHFYVDRTFSENEAREFSQWVSRNVSSQKQPNYDASGSSPTPKIPL